MTTPPARLRFRTPQACDRCRRSKTKCNGDRPQCRSCLKRKVACSWPTNTTPVTFYALTPPQEQDTPPRNRLERNRESHPAILDTPSQFDLPEAHLVERLLQLFMEKHHDVELCSFFHKPSLDIPTLHSRSPLLVASVFSLAALYVPTDEVEADFGFESPSALSDHYARVARSYACDLFHKPSICTIQAFLILAIRELLTWSNAKAYMYAGTALRMAQAMDLNVEAGRHYSARQKEIRKRTFWACFVVDRLISYTCNKPFTVSFTSPSLQLPCSDNAFAFDEVHAGITVEDLALHANQVSQLGIMPFFITMVGLWAEMASLHVSGGRRSSRYGPHAPESDFYKTAHAIEKFSWNLPASLYWSPQNYKLHQFTGQAQAFVNLNFMLHHSNCVMHQEYLPQLDTQYSLDLPLSSTDATAYDTAGISLDSIDKPLITTCTAAINAITEMAFLLHAGSEKDRSLLQSIPAATAILTASAVHLWILWTQTCDACPKDEAMDKAFKLRLIIKSWTPQWRVANAWVETLEMLYNLYVYSYGKVIETDFDFEFCWNLPNDDMAGDEATADNMSTVHHRLYDKIRSILVNPLLETDVKKRNLRIYCRSLSLWQHMWAYAPIDGVEDGSFGDLGNFMADPGAEILDMPSLNVRSGNI